MINKAYRGKKKLGKIISLSTFIAISQFDFPREVGPFLRACHIYVLHEYLHPCTQAASCREAATRYALFLPWCSNRHMAQMFTYMAV